MTASEFQHDVLAWFDRFGRKNLPWQTNISPYRVWISEIMLQQTQVSTVIPYFNTFMQHFPAIEDLAAAPVDKVLQLWSGLGYYARARNLHKTAQIIVESGGQFPDQLEQITGLPGIGQSTAGAILSIAFKKSQPILDGNVKRVLARFHAISGWTGDSRVNKELWQLSSIYTPTERVGDYTQAMMDLGATVCTRAKPKCQQCPLQQACVAYQEDKTGVLPTPRPKKTLPVKKSFILQLSNRDQLVYLHKRPPSGIWGGLWSLPEFDSINSLQRWCSQHNIPIFQQERLPEQRHTFSHYHLDYTPILIKTDNPNNFVMEADQALWYKAEQINTLALAAPIKRLLQQTLLELTND